MKIALSLSFFLGISSISVTDSKDTSQLASMRSFVFAVGQVSGLDFLTFYAESIEPSHKDIHLLELVIDKYNHE